jgi:hypothetical protein
LSRQQKVSNLAETSRHGMTPTHLRQQVSTISTAGEWTHCLRPATLNKEEVPGPSPGRPTLQNARRARRPWIQLGNLGPGPADASTGRSCGVGSVEEVVCDAGLRSRWHRHQDARDDKDDPSKQPATNTTSHDPHLPPRAHRRTDEDSSRSTPQIGRLRRRTLRPTHEPWRAAVPAWTIRPCMRYRAGAVTGHTPCGEGQPPDMGLGSHRGSRLLLVGSPGGPA